MEMIVTFADSGSSISYMKRALRFVWKYAIVGCCVLLQVAVYLLSHCNDGRWLVNLLSYGIPLLFLLQGILLVVLAVQHKGWSLAATIVTGLFLQWKAIHETIAFNNWFTNHPKDEKTLDLLSFNVSTFNKNRTEMFMSDDSLFTSDFFDYLEEHKEALDVMCIQEFHHDDGENDRIIDEIVSITGMGYYYTVPIWQSVQNGFFGIMTFSKYPIVGAGTLFVGEEYTINRGIFTDIAYEGDTIRIINIHLHSMSIRLNGQDSLDYEDRANDIFDKLRAGSLKSKKQIGSVIRAIERSKHPVIVCGDFNTFPYGFAYQEVKKRLHNSFENAGNGFGFTLNIFPYFVRVDNQFYSKEFEPVTAMVERKIHLSDHFPVLGKYRLVAPQHPTHMAADSAISASH